MPGECVANSGKVFRTEIGEGIFNVFSSSPHKKAQQRCLNKTSLCPGPQIKRPRNEGSELGMQMCERVWAAEGV